MSPATTAANVEAIFIASAGGESMVRAEVAQALTGLGLEGDRYATGRGYYSPRDVCQVTLIESAALWRMSDEFGVRLSDGEHRRNLVIRGVTEDQLRGRRFRLGRAIFEYDRHRPPCGYLARLTEPMMTRAMGIGPGFGARVLEGGLIRCGDAIEILNADERVRVSRLP